MSRLRAKRSAWGSYANCWKSLGAGTTPGCGVGKAPGKRPIRPCSGNWCACTRNTLPWGWTACTTCSSPSFHCSRGRVAPADEGRRHPLPTKEGLQSHHQLPATTVPSRQTCSNASSLSAAPNQAWVGDITYIPTGEGWLYFAIVKDLCTRKIVGYAFSQRIDTQLTLDALNMAVRRERPAPGLTLPQRPGRPVRRRGLP